MSMIINFGRVRFYNEKFPFHKVTRSLYHVVLQDHGNYFSCCITATTRPMDSNIGKVVTYYEKRQLINSHNSLNKRSSEVTWNNKLKTLYIKNILSPLPQYLWLSNVARWLHITLSLGAVSNFDYLITFLGLDRKHYSIHRLLVVFYFFFCMYFDLWLLIQGIYLYNFCWFQYNIFSLLW